MSSGVVRDVRSAPFERAISHAPTTIAAISSNQPPAIQSQPAAVISQPYIIEVPLSSADLRRGAAGRGRAVWPGPWRPLDVGGFAMCGILGGSIRVGGPRNMNLPLLLSVLRGRSELRSHDRWSR